MNKRALVKAGIALGLMSPMLLSVPPSAFAFAPTLSPRQNDTTVICRQGDADGLLKVLGVTLGECMNVLRPPAAVNPQANADNAGLCGVDFFLLDIGATSKGQCIQALEPSSHLPFKVTLRESLDQFGPVSGTGTASRMNAVSETGAIYAYDFSSYPASVDFYVTGTITDAKADQLFVDYHATFTDTANPPVGESYRETGLFGITGGAGKFARAVGHGTIAGTCTSSFGDPVLRCDNTWTGTIGF